LIDKEKLGVNKLMHNTLSDCDLYLIEDKEGKTYLLFVFNNYFKIMPAYPGKWDCEESLYRPFGLFGFVFEGEDINEKIKKKLEELKSVGL
jgi:hypothetical protein